MEGITDIDLIAVNRLVRSIRRKVELRSDSEALGYIRKFYLKAEREGHQRRYRGKKAGYYTALLQLAAAAVYAMKERIPVEERKDFTAVIDEIFKPGKKDKSEGDRT